MKKLKRLLFVKIWFLFLATPQLGHADDVVHMRHWRDFSYTGRMAQYKPYVHCVTWTAYQFKLPEELLFSILKQEAGSVNSPGSLNNNKTRDYGPGQINDIRIPELKQFDVNKKELISNGCANIWSVGYLLRKEIDKASDFWTGVGNYHYSINGSAPKHHYLYVSQIRGHWADLYKKFNN